MIEQNGAEHRDLGQEGHGPGRDAINLAHFDQGRAEHGTEAAAQEGEGQAGHHLFRAQNQGHEGVQQGHQAADHHRRQDPQPGIAGQPGDAEPRHGAHQHHALDPQVEDAGPFREEFAQRGEQYGGAGAHPGRQHGRQEGDHSSVSDARRRIRYRISRLPLTITKRITPCSSEEMPAD